jgi:hypothetical protein
MGDDTEDEGSEIIYCRYEGQCADRTPENCPSCVRIIVEPQEDAP